MMEGATTIKVQAVLEDQVYRDVDLVPMLCAEITDKTRTSNIIRVLNEHFPLPEFPHLKRVNGGERPRVLVCALESEDEQLMEGPRAQLERLGLLGLGAVSTVLVPQWKPFTRAQYNTVSRLWPTHFHEDKMLEKTLRHEMFPAEELLQITKFMLCALNGKKNSEDNISSVIIVDPDTNAVVARACTDPSHPLKHATMLCLDQVATQQGGGAWRETCSSPFGDKTVPKSERQPMGITTTAKMRDALECPSAKRIKLQYLCTGYDAYCSAEPCVMCCMALLHSRIRRVFFCHTNSSSGGLYSYYKLHLHKKLNHHFQVYKCTLTCSIGDTATRSV